MELIYIHNMYPKSVYKTKFGHSKFYPPPNLFCQRLQTCTGVSLLKLPVPVYWVVHGGISRACFRGEDPTLTQNNGQENNTFKTHHIVMYDKHMTEQLQTIVIWISRCHLQCYTQRRTKNISTHADT